MEPRRQKTRSKTSLLTQGIRMSARTIGSTALYRRGRGKGSRVSPNEVALTYPPWRRAQRCPPLLASSEASSTPTPARARP